MQFRQLPARFQARFKRRAPWWALAGLIQFLALWGQQGLPVAGTLAASVITAWIFGSLRGREWWPKALRLSLLGLIFFPLAGVWIVLWELSRMSFAGLLWSWPLFWGMALGYLILNQAATRILRQGLTIDGALMISGKLIRENLPGYCLIALCLSALWLLGFIGGGLGFILAAPLSFALFDMDSESILNA